MDTPEMSLKVQHISKLLTRLKFLLPKLVIFLAPKKSVLLSDPEWDLAKATHTNEHLKRLSFFHLGSGCNEQRQRSLLSDHYKRFLAAKQERILIDHRLNDVFKVWTHRFESKHVGEFDGKEGRPPADRQIFAVHAVQFRVLGHPTEEKLLVNRENRISRQNT